MGRPLNRSLTGARPAGARTRAAATSGTVASTTTTTKDTTSPTLRTSPALTASTTTKPAASASLPTTPAIGFSKTDDSSLTSVFHFTAGPLSSKLVFTRTRERASSLDRKRCRPLDDVDGEHSSQSRKKKRRLRLFLITSRLSPVFSQPATYIVDRGSSKIAVWAKQRALGRNLLRKAAILNYARRRERQQKQQQQYSLQQRHMEMARETFLYGSHDTLTHPVVCASRAPFARTTPIPPSTNNIAASTKAAPSTSPNFNPNLPALSSPPLLVIRGPYLQHSLPSSSALTDDGTSATACRKTGPPSAQVPRRDYIPLPPSPLGLSNYDAFDLEDDFSMNDDDSNEGDDDVSSFGSSFGGTYSRRFSGGHRESGWPGRDVSPSASPPTIYSDFSVLDPMEAVVEDHDLIEAFAGTSTTAGVGALEEVWNEAEKRREAERKRAEERLQEIKEEKERQRQFVFAGLKGFVI